MDEENNNQESTVKKVVDDTGKKISQGIKSKFIKWLPKLLPIIGGIFLVIIAFCVIYLLVNLVISFFTSLLSIFSPTQDANSNANSINQTSSIIYIDEDSGAYKIQDNFSEKILEELDRQSINAEAAEFITEDIEDMLDKYIKAEVQTMFPKTGVWGNDVDGLITIQRASTDRNN